MLNFTKRGKRIGVWQDPDTGLFRGVLATKEGQLVEMTGLGYTEEAIAIEAIELLVTAAEATTSAPHKPEVE